MANSPTESNAAGAGDQKSHLNQGPKKSLNWVPIREFQSQGLISAFLPQPDPGLIEMLADHGGRFNQGASSSLTKCSSSPYKVKKFMWFLILPVEDDLWSQWLQWLDDLFIIHESITFHLVTN